MKNKITPSVYVDKSNDDQILKDISHLLAHKISEIHMAKKDEFLFVNFYDKDILFLEYAKYSTKRHCICHFSETSYLEVMPKVISSLWDFGDYANNEFSPVFTMSDKEINTLIKKYRKIQLEDKIKTMGNLEEMVGTIQETNDFI